jgi:2-polyprenyl-3-methyl-5-hydroxy-6-metoxy-1,4-benzoquinol methylase
MSSQPSPPGENIEALVEQIREAARLHRAMPERSFSSGGPGDTSPGSAAYLDSYLTELARRSQPRTELPHRFRRFPLTIAPIGRLAVRIYNLLTKEQRETDIVLRDALQTLQAVVAHQEKTTREENILHDYIRAQLGRGLLTRNGKAGAGPSGTTAETKGLLPELDAFFVALGDRFRGPPELVTERLRVYLPTVRSAGLGGPALDLGCGRGEWLDMMRESAIEAVGVEQSPRLVGICRDKGLQVVEADLEAFLEQGPAEQWQIVTAFHVIEHLGWPGWYVFLRQCHRVLRPGGMLILETPNPGNLITAANRFHLDPTHQHPLPDALLEFAAKSVGFGPNQIMPLHHELEGAPKAAPSGTIAEIARHLFGSQDYALIARK